MSLPFRDGETEAPRGGPRLQRGSEASGGRFTSACRAPQRWGLLPSSISPTPLLEGLHLDRPATLHKVLYNTVPWFPHLPGARAGPEWGFPCRLWLTWELHVRQI